MAKKIVAIVGTYRKGRTIDTAVDEILKSAQSLGAQTEKIFLLDKHIEFCTNCRSCVQKAGAKRGDCVIDDDMKNILDQIDSADAVVLAAPVNWFNVTAVMKKFIERLMPYGYWPWGKGIPKYRIKKLTKKAVLITASAAPAFIGRLFFPGTLSILKSAAKCVGARVIKKIYIGTAAVTEDQPLSEKYKKQLFNAGQLLVS
jgi:putative NADPH-quinone reductase